MKCLLLAILLLPQAAGAHGSAQEHAGHWLGTLIHYGLPFGGLLLAAVLMYQKRERKEKSLPNPKAR